MKRRIICQVFSATLAKDRERLGEEVTRWLDQHPDFELKERVTTQSSDQEYHCITITIWGEAPPR